MIRRAFPIAAAVVIASVATAALAHDFWIAPAKFRVAKGDTVELPLRNGVEYAGSPVARDDLRIEAFVALGPGAEITVTGENKKDPAGRFTPTAEGIWVVGYRSRPRSIELEAPKFEEYLREEGLQHVAKLREDRKESEKPGRELFSRCAKALFLVGPVAKEGHDRVVGQRLEIIPETNPFTASAGTEMTFRMVFEEKALANGLVVARSRAEPKHVRSARTDAEGRVRLTLDRSGEWLVKCVHMVAAPAESGMDWESLWASVTFDLTEAEKPAVEVAEPPAAPSAPSAPSGPGTPPK